MIEDKVKVIKKENVPDKIKINVPDKINKNIEDMNNKLKDKAARLFHRAPTSTTRWNKNLE